MTVSGPVSDGRAATNNTEHRYQLRGLTLPRSATRHLQHLVVDAFGMGPQRGPALVVIVIRARVGRVTSPAWLR